MTELKDRRIQTALYDREDDTLFLVDSERHLWALKPDNYERDEDFGPCIFSIRGAENLQDAKIKDAKTIASVENSVVDGVATHYVETAIETDKGVACVIVAYDGDSPLASPEILIAPFKGYPPESATSLTDFVRASLPWERHENDEAMHRMLPNHTATLSRVGSCL